MVSVSCRTGQLKATLTTLNCTNYLWFATAGNEASADLNIAKDL